MLLTTSKKYDKSALGALTSSLCKDALKCGYSKIRLTISFTVYNFGNTLAMNVIFFFEKWREKLRECFDFFRELHLTLYLQIPNITKRILVIGTQCFNKDSNNLNINKRELSQVSLTQSDNEIL